MKNQNDKTKNDNPQNDNVVLTTQIISDLIKSDKWFGTINNYCPKFLEHLIDQCIAIGFDKWESFIQTTIPIALSNTVLKFESNKFEIIDNPSNTGKIIIFNYSGKLLTIDKSKHIATAIANNFGTQIDGIPQITKTNSDLTFDDKLNIIKNDKSKSGFDRFMEKLNSIDDQKQKSRLVNSEYNRITK